MRVLSKGAGREEHPIDGHYRGLNCQLSPIDHEDDSFKVSRPLRDVDIGIETDKLFPLSAGDSGTIERPYNCRGVDYAPPPSPF